MAAPNLEPRVTKVETELLAIGRDISSLTSAVSSLTTVVREQGTNSEREMRQLSIAITTASGPRRTDWGVIFSGIGLILAIGAAALSPLYMRMGDVQFAEVQIIKNLKDHETIHMHPVGENRVNAMEKAIETAISGNILAVKELDEKLQREMGLTLATFQERMVFNAEQIRVLDERLQREFKLMDINIRERILDVQKQVDEMKSYNLPMRERIAIVEANVNRQTMQNIPVQRQTP